MNVYPLVYYSSLEKLVLSAFVSFHLDKVFEAFIMTKDPRGRLFVMHPFPCYSLSIAFVTKNETITTLNLNWGYRPLGSLPTHPEGCILIQHGGS